MTTTTKIILILAIIAAGGIGAYVYVTRPAPEPTSDIVAEEIIPTQKNDSTTDQTVRTINIGIISAESSAEFRLNELLRGTKTVVIGKTNTLTGDIGVTFSPAHITLGTIKINARTLKTDDEKRNGAIARMILHSDKAENEFITFSNTTVTGLPATITPGSSFTFTATGDLLINGKTKKTTFTGNGNVTADNSFIGSATTTVNHTDFDLKIPDFPFLADVDTQSQITVSFVAR